ncbi:NADH dehydrogenase 1 alpha subcomplex assembly factor 3 [Thelonectria olida]|uniref:NADH dehydrogenase 1 alpha subcomplex assembly factor 3 n=1 Tax=Thelonectria olida TaxID=1576542 RepID=A0A9P8WAC2_9HYPO|nr:NADH dehydrogenase 1 alpha subcomplex assembly factor 3 [Thelonectria olida]
MAARGLMRPCAGPRAFRQTLSSCSTSQSRAAFTAFRSQPSTPSTLLQTSSPKTRFFHAVPSQRKSQGAPAQPPPTDFGELDVLANTPIPSTSVDVCTYDGFGLNSGVTITDGNGVMLIDGEVFNWRPWEAKGSKVLANKKGQLEIPANSFAVLDLLWPRPDLLIIGTGPSIMPLSPETRRHIAALGIRVEVLDTRNAAAQFNLLATERGVNDVAAAMIPIGWKEGVGAE